MSDQQVLTLPSVDTEFQEFVDTMTDWLTNRTESAPCEVAHELIPGLECSGGAYARLICCVAQLNGCKNTWEYWTKSIERDGKCQVCKKPCRDCWKVVLI